MAATRFSANRKSLGFHTILDISLFAVGMVQTYFLGQPYIYWISKADFYIESPRLLKKIPTWHLPWAFFSKNFSVTQGSTRTDNFRWVVAFSKRCIFLHIGNEKLISGPYEEVCISVFSKNGWVTLGSTRTGHFRQVVAFLKRCIFLHIVLVKLISGPFEDVCISTFFKKPFVLY